MRSSFRPRSGLWRWLPVICLLAAGCTTLPSAVKTPGELPADTPFSHDAFQRVLTRYVDDRGFVDYAALAEDPADLERYTDQLASRSPDSHPQDFPTSESRLAYWINAYNASTIRLVLRHYPISSVMDVKPPAVFFFMPRGSGFFVFHRVVLGGVPVSLYSLENQVVRKRFTDPRYHFALNCASIGCPRLPRQAFTADNLESMLATEARRFMGEDRNFRVDHGAKRVYLSEIIDWFEADFLAVREETSSPTGAPPILEALSPYFPPGSPLEQQSFTGYEIDYTPYDWGLNDASAP